jgi:TrmH family RNA methyltransferase
VVQGITTRNARFQQLQTLLTNRTKRGRAQQFIVQGVRPITMAEKYGWTISCVLFDPKRSLSSWAREFLARHQRAEQLAVTPELLAELSEKDEGAVELLAVVEMRSDDLSRIEVDSTFLGLVFDRPCSRAISAPSCARRMPSARTV